MAGLLALKLSVGIVVGLALGWLATRVMERVELPTDGIYPVATIAIAGLAYGVSESIHGSGLLAVYLTALALGGAPIPARRTIVTFHEGRRLGRPDRPLHPARPARLPQHLGDVALKGLALSAVLILSPARSRPSSRPR